MAEKRERLVLRIHSLRAVAADYLSEYIRQRVVLHFSCNPFLLDVRLYLLSARIADSSVPDRTFASVRFEFRNPPVKEDVKMNLHRMLPGSHDNKVSLRHRTYLLRCHQIDRNNTFGRVL